MAYDYPNEPGFEAVRVAVLDNAATSIRLEVQAHSSFSVAGKLAGRLKEVGLKLGASSENCRYSYFLLEANFPRDAEQVGT